MSSVIFTGTDLARDDGCVAVPTPLGFPRSLSLARGDGRRRGDRSHLVLTEQEVNPADLALLEGDHLNVTAFTDHFFHEAAYLLHHASTGSAWPRT